jgi:predicted permease
LGIGVNTAIFSAVNDLILRPVVAERPDELARVFFGSQQRARVYDEISWPNYVDLREQSRSFTDLLGFRFTWVALGSSAEQRASEGAEVIFGEMVTGNYFDLLGVHPALGRAFLPEEGNTPNKHPVVVLSHSLWQRRFNTDASLIGKTVYLNGQPFTVIGIAPTDFKGLKFPLAMDFWTPMMMRDQLSGESRWMADRGMDLMDVVGRLKPGLRLEQAEAEINVLAQNLGKAYPETNEGTKFQVVPESEGRLDDGFPVINFSGMLALAVVSLVLLAACANVANLLLARGSARAKEIGVRLALGSPRWRIVRQLLTESVLLALLGGMLGLILAVWCADLMRASIPPFPFQVDLDFAPDWRALRWALLISLLTGIIFGLAPALHAARTNLITVLKSDSGSASMSGIRRRFNLRNVLVITQVAISVIVLLCAGLLLRSLHNAQATDPGFKAENLVSMALSPGLLGYSVDESKRFYLELQRRIASVPGVRAASVTDTLQLGDSASSTGPLILDGQAPPPPNQGLMIGYLLVGAKYFETIGTQLLLGREFTERDNDDAPKVVIINQELARRLFGGERQALGQRFRLGDLSSPLLEIVGIAKDGKYRSLYEDARPYMFLPQMQQRQRANLSIAYLLASANSASDLKAVAEAMRREAQKLDSRVPVMDIKVAEQHLSWAYWGPRLGASIAAGFGVLALLLATTGLYSVMSYTVSRRVREIGIRMALGAQRADVMSLVIKQGMKLALIGVMIGAAGAFALSRVLSNLLLGVSATDPLTFIMISVLLAGLAWLACYLPARRATKVDPMVALRYE